jgi:hypothetical protein
VPTDELRARFDAELVAAGPRLTGPDYENVFAMWCDHLPARERLRALALGPDDEPWR